MTYWQFEATCSISFTSTYKTFNHHLVVNGLFQLGQMLTNSIALLQKTCITVSQVANHKFMYTKRETKNSRLNGCFKMNQIEQKLFTLKALRNNDETTGHAATVPGQENWQNSEFCMIQNPLFTPRLRRNKFILLDEIVITNYYFVLFRLKI